MLWRVQSDLVNRRLIERWLSGDLGRVLKTDLFDECVSEGLFPALAPRASQVAGVDTAQAVVAGAARRHPGLDGRLGDVRDLPFDGECFDAVVSNSTLDHLEGAAEVETALGELYRVMRPGGRLVLTVDNPYNPLVAARNALPEAIARAMRPTLYFSAWTCGPRRLSALLNRSGFDVVDTTAILHFPRIVVAVAGALSPGLARRPRVPALLRGAEELERWPSRYLTGHFVATLAVRRPAPAG
jgi:SAM-dependent methyltransferase